MWNMTIALFYVVFGAFYIRHGILYVKMKQTPHRKVKIKKHEPVKLGVNPGAPER